MRWLLLLLPLVALAACSAQPETRVNGRTETTTTASTNISQNSLADQFQKQGRDALALHKVCKTLFNGAKFSDGWTSWFWLSVIRSKSGAKLYSFSTSDPNNCIISVLGHYGKEYKAASCESLVFNNSNPYTCYYTTERGNIVRYSRTHGDKVKRAVIAEPLKENITNVQPTQKSSMPNSDREQYLKDIGFYD